MDAKSARTLSLLSLKAKKEKELAPVFKEIEEAASQGRFCLDFYYSGNVKTYSLVRCHKVFLEKMGYTVTYYKTTYQGNMWRIEWSN